jgi:hypothetical protein
MVDSGVPYRPTVSKPEDQNVAMSIYLVVFVIPLLAALAGVLRRGAKRPDPLVLIGAGALGALFAVLAATTHDPAVSSGDAVQGVVLAALLGAVPPYAFFLLGRALAEHRITLGLICVASAVPVTYLYVLGWIIVVGLVHCPPDAYECPI